MPQLASRTAESQPASPVVATPPVRSHTVVLNGRPVLFDVSPRITNGRMQAGFRSMFESQGAKVTWNPESRIAKSVAGALVVEVPVGERIAKVNGAPFDMGVEASIVEGRTLVPVRFFATVVGAGLYWDHQTRTASVQVPGQQFAVRAAVE